VECRIPGQGARAERDRAGARALGVRVLPVAVRGSDDFETAFASIRAARADALVVAEPLTLGHQKAIAEFAAQNRLPMISEIKEFADAGGLMTYGASPSDLHRLAAGNVDKIPKGAVPGERPVDAAHFELVVNLRTAKTLYLTVQQSILVRRRSDRVRPAPRRFDARQRWSVIAIICREA
jgi:putative tryptophan/tyrosine transport system substrate-binding protein